jgi:hypothetical protein
LPRAGPMPAAWWRRARGRHRDPARCAGRRFGRAPGARRRAAKHGHADGVRSAAGSSVCRASRFGEEDEGVSGVRPRRGDRPGTEDAVDARRCSRRSATRGRTVQPAHPATMRSAADSSATRVRLSCSFGRPSDVISSPVTLRNVTRNERRRTCS